MANTVWPKRKNPNGRKSSCTVPFWQAPTIDRSSSFSKQKMVFMLWKTNVTTKRKTVEQSEFWFVEKNRQIKYLQMKHILFAGGVNTNWYIKTTENRGNCGKAPIWEIRKSQNDLKKFMDDTKRFCRPAHPPGGSKNVILCSSNK